MGAKRAVRSPNSEMNDEGEEEGTREHVEQLQRLQDKDPEFYQFLKENDKELLEFQDEDIDEVESDMDPAELLEDDQANAYDMEQSTSATVVKKLRKSVLTSAMVDSWINSIQEKRTAGAVGSILRAFRTACHCGDDGGDESSTKSSINSSSVFNKIMLYVLKEMDGILRELLKLPSSGGKKEMVTDLMRTKLWKKFNHFVKSYIGNALHVLNEMTDAEMISFTLRHLRYSSIFLAAFPSLLRKYIKVVLHFWGTGGGALPVASFLFLRDMCIRLGSDCTDECFKGIYKAYVLNCHFVNAVKLQHIQFLANCVIELLGVDLPTAYQHAFVFIRQLAMILRDALTRKTKDSFRKIYEWKYINSLELWTGLICTYSSETDIMPLAYPLTQIISGVARSAQKAQYFPLRLRCVRMLNRIAASTGTFVPISMLLLDMLEMKELNKPPTGGVGKAIDLRVTLKVSKQTLKTRSFQEACVSSVIEELADHLAQWSYSIAFFEISFVPAAWLRNFCKSTKIDRFRREMRELIRQIGSNSKFTNERRMLISFLPNDPAVASFLEDEKKLGASPLSQYVATLHKKAQERNDSLLETSVVVGAHSSVSGNKISETEENTTIEESAAVFSSSWLPGGNLKAKKPKEENKTNKKKKSRTEQEGAALYEDVVEDLVLSSDEDEFERNAPFMGEDAKAESSKPQRNKRKWSMDSAKKSNVQINGKKSGKGNKRKRAN